MIDTFLPKRTQNTDTRIEAIEQYLGALADAVRIETTRPQTVQQQGLTFSTATSGGGTAAGGSSSAGSGRIPESSVIFDPTSGHAHDGTDSHSITIAGDVSGTNVASTVDKLKGKALPAAPGASQDKQILRWDNGGGAYAFTDTTNLTVLGVWVKPDVSTLGAADADIDNAWAGTAGVTLANPMVRAGALVGITLKATGDVGGAGQNVVATCYKNGSSTALTATITGGAGTEDEAVATVSPVTFSAGDDIKIEMKYSGVAPAAVRVMAIVYGFLA